MKVPKPIKQPSGNYFLRLRLGGESIPITEISAAACIKKAQIIKAEYLSSREVKKKSDLTAEQAIENYITTHPKLSESTVRGYDIIKRNRFKAYMKKPMRSVDWAKAFDEERLILKSPKTLNNATSFLKTILKENDLPVPKYDPVKVNRKINMRPWLNYEEIAIFVKSVTKEHYAIPALLALHGLRRSEIIGLTWDKIDLNHGKYGIINVRGAVVPDRNNKLVRRKENKSEAGTRHVPIMIPELKTLLESQVGTELHFGHPDSIRQQVKRTCTKSGITEVTTHGLRHSFASLCHHLGVPEAECAKLGGWDDLKTMHEIYMHLADADIDRDVSILSNFFESLNA